MKFSTTCYLQSSVSRGYDSIMDALASDLQRFLARRKFGEDMQRWIHVPTLVDLDPDPELMAEFDSRTKELWTGCSIDITIWRRLKRQARVKLLYASMMRALLEARSIKRIAPQIERLIAAFDLFGQRIGLGRVDLYQPGIGPKRKKRKPPKEEYLIEIQFKLSNREFGTEQEREKLFQIERRIMDGLSGFKGAYCDGNEIGGGYYSVVLIAKQYEETVRHVEKYVAAHEFTPGSRVTVRALHKELARSKRVEFSPKKGSGTRREKK